MVNQPNLKMCIETAVINLSVEENVKHSFVNVRIPANHPNILV
jgi:hypothetical protein